MFKVSIYIVRAPFTAGFACWAAERHRVIYAKPRIVLLEVYRNKDSVEKCVIDDLKNDLDMKRLRIHKPVLVLLPSASTMEAFP